MSHSSPPPPTAAQPRTTNVDALLRDGQPDWALIQSEVVCSRCGYNLRLLTQPRCPECGLPFDWRTVLDASAWRSDFLFEHHWRTRPFAAWAKTTLAGLRPFRFWTRVSIHDHVQPGPLWFLLLTSSIWFFFTLSTLTWFGHEAVLLLSRRGSASGGLTQWRFLDRVEQALSGLFFDLYPPTKQLPWLYGLLGGWLAALGVLCCLRQTLGRCRVRTIQLLRVFAYASTPMFICLAVLFVLSISLVVSIDTGRTPPALVIGTVVFGLVVLFACPVVFLTAGIKRYLQLPRAPLLAIAALVVGILFVLTLSILLAMLGHRF